MTMQVQLDLFRTPEECEIEALRFELMATKTSLEKVRKGTYCSINELRKTCAELELRQKVIEKGICHVK